MQPLDNTTYAQSDGQFDTIVGDAKQPVFYPRLKIEKWDNEANFSIGTTDTGGTHTLVGDTVVYETDQSITRFYPKQPDAIFDKTYIRLINLGAIPPQRIGAIYEVNKSIPEAAQTINVHWCDRKAIMYYGYYEADDYIDQAKVNVPQMRVAMWGHQNDPMLMDSTLKLIDIHYDALRDNVDKIESSIKQAVKNVLADYPIEIIDTGGGKLYWVDGDRQVKFYSGAFIGGHYYFYLNLGLDYNAIQNYYLDGVSLSTRDQYAYGLPNVPDSVVNDIITEYANLYGLPLMAQPYADNETALVSALEPLHLDNNWILHANRDDVYDPTDGTEGGDFEFEYVLKKKPISNVIPMTIQSKNLAFYKQLPLTAEERNQGYYRSPFIENSYAVYHVNNANGVYETGKALHIKQLWVADSSIVDNTGRPIGNKRWCDLNIPVDANGIPTSTDVTITIPQDFLDSAVYPILIDPTLGYTAAGASNTSYSDANDYITLLAQTGTAVTAKWIVFYGSVSGDATHTNKLTPTIYQNNNGNRIDYGSEMSTNNSTDFGVNWWPRATNGNASLASATSYNIGAEMSLQTGASYTGAGIYYDTVTNAGANTSSNTYASPPPVGEPVATTNNNKYSFYVTDTLILPKVYEFKQAITRAAYY